MNTSSGGGFLPVALAGLLALTSGTRAVDVLPSIPKGSIAIHLTPLATGLAAPDHAINAPGDPSRLFVLEQKGQILLHGSLLPTPRSTSKAWFPRRSSSPMPTTSGDCSGWRSIPASTPRPARVIARSTPTTASSFPRATRQHTSLPTVPRKGSRTRSTNGS